MRASTTRPARAARLLGVVVVALGLLGCSPPADRLPEALLGPTTELVAVRAGAAAVAVGAEDAECVARRLTEPEALELAELAEEDLPLTPELAARLSQLILGCVDADVLARSAIAPFTMGAGEASLQCAADRLNTELIEALVAANLAASPLAGARLELAVATALGLCLEPEELLNRG